MDTAQVLEPEETTAPTLGVALGLAQASMDTMATMVTTHPTLAQGWAQAQALEAMALEQAVAQVLVVTTVQPVELGLVDTARVAAVPTQAQVLLSPLLLACWMAPQFALLFPYSVLPSGVDAACSADLAS